MALTCTDICKFLFAIFFPPLGVLMEKGCGKGISFYDIFVLDFNILW
ncbi:uncharacterized protein T551_01068 [Pneumocystis jirovecii RU7]|uniref:Plasma membrane proteolipid 3 n=1 Tax=Pneumocystis jirovecii (strain RU7) TaxID=1408657 RepID=A0A0W4ZTV1_PNEJ7|nr:uncharacterized protein T551_01068 [Pneumocystis jirovecii RU7]KTW31807.1 hypothetical protein T551_01068 [Pneumocystis jirovecii RU7]